MRDDLRAAFRSFRSSPTFTIVALIARLKPGVTVDRARAQMDQIAAALQQAHPEWNKGRTIGVRPLRDHIVGAQQPVFSAELAIRTSGDPYAVLPAVKAAVLAVLPDVPLRNVRTMEEIIGRRVAQRKLNMLLLGLFGLLGLVISAAGIYGVMAYVVAQRTQEIGVRMALGATRRRVIAMVLTSSLTLVLAGLVIGSISAWYLSEAAKTFLFGLQAHDLRAFGAATVVLLLAALVASAVPARRAASVDPMVALRTE